MAPPASDNNTDDAAGKFGAPVHWTVRMMGRLARQLNLRPHYVRESRTGRAVVVDTCADLEGHLGTDGRLYVLDVARIMPPEAPYDDAASNDDADDADDDDDDDDDDDADDDDDDDDDDGDDTAVSASASASASASPAAALPPGVCP